MVGGWDCSDTVLGEGTNDRSFNILMFELIYVGHGEEEEGEDRENDVEGVPKLATHFPWMYLSWFSHSVPVFLPCMEPM